MASRGSIVDSLFAKHLTLQIQITYSQNFTLTKIQVFTVSCEYQSNINFAILIQQHGILQSI